jgi:hypothetical protein
MESVVLWADTRKAELKPYHNLIRGRYFSNLSSAKLAVLNVCRSSRADTTGFRWCVYANKNNIRLGDCCINIRREEQVPREVVVRS